MFLPWLLSVFGAYCFPVWISSVASHLVLDRVVSKAVRLSDDLVVSDLERRCRVAALCMFYKINCNPNHA